MLGLPHVSLRGAPPPSLMRLKEPLSRVLAERVGPVLVPGGLKHCPVHCPHPSSDRSGL